MKTNLLKLTLIISCICLRVHAQSPQAIPYQAVARNNAGSPLVNQNISVRFSIHNASDVGTVVFQESHSVTTNSLGMFTVNIGQGIILSGTFPGIDWGGGSKYLQVEMDADGGNSYSDMGTQQLLSVPYALYAGNSSSGLPNGNANGNTIRWNGTAWISDNAIYNDGTNVGIGTSSPGAKLDVSGRIKINDGTQGDRKVLKSDAGGVASWGTLDGNNILSSPIIPDMSCLAVSGSVATSDNPNSVAVSGNYAYVVSSAANTMQVMNISNPASPSLIGSVATEDGTYAIAVSGNYAYVANSTSGTMQVINISNPSSPSIVSSLPTAGLPFSLAVSGNYVYVANYAGDNMQVINVTNPSSPVVVGSVATGSYPASIAVSGNYAYVVNNFDNTMQVINVSNPSSPIVTGSVSTGNNPLSIAVSANYAYVINNGSSTMQVINISNPASPVVTGSVATGAFPYLVVSEGNYAYVVNNSGQTMQVINVSNPASPAVIGTVGTGNNPVSLDVSGNYAYVVNELSNTLQVVNLLCPGNYVVTVNPLTNETTGQLTQWISSGNDISNSNSGNVFISGSLDVSGTLSKGSGSFKIDDPADPANKILYHSFVESPDMMNVYNGNIITDDNGLATVVLPEYFEALNKDFRYQLTAIGDFAQLIIYKEVQNNSFVVKSDKPNIKVSWQVTGIRQDAFANKYRIPNVVDKNANERGLYIHPDAFGLSDEYNLKNEQSKSAGIK